MFVNTNGNVTFSGAVPTYTPEAFSVADRPITAPLWADVDIRGTACTEPDGGTGYTGDCRCVPSACADVTCTMGQFCERGTCRDACFVRRAR